MRDEDRTTMRARLWLALGLACVFVFQASASIRPGITWDEPTYVAAGYSQCLWFARLGTDALSRDAIDAHWRQNSEHPPAAKMLYGLAGVIEGGRDIPALYTARLFAAAMFTLLVGLVYAFMARLYGRAAGAVAAAALALMPRVFGDGHFAALDAPVALACFAAAWAFVRARGRPGWMLAAGALWGLALLTKANAVLVPVVLVPWAVWRWRAKAIGPCAALLLVGSLVFVAGWPWLWRDTARRVEAYVLNKTERLTGGDRPTGTTNVPVCYLGNMYRDERAPWHYPFVLTLATIPVGLLVMSGVGVGAAVRRRRDDEEGRRGVGALILASALLPLVAAALPMAPKYDGVRLFLPAFPFIACLAGLGVTILWRWRGWLGRGIVIAAFAASAAALAFTHPYELSYYNALTGGAWGANRLGFETTYWGDTVNRDVLDYVNANWSGRDGARVTVLPQYQAFLTTLPGLRPELVFVKKFDPAHPPDCLIIFARQGYFDDATRKVLETAKPQREWTYLGVWQCRVYGLVVSADAGRRSMAEKR